MPDPQPVVSVLVLAYDHAPFIEQTLRSILQQDFAEPFEVVVGEDVSTDGTLDVIRTVASSDPRVRVISGPSNVGMAANHRRIVLAARGEFVAYCEGDDYWQDRSKLSREVAALRADRSLAGVHTDFDRLELSGGVVQSFARQVYGDMPARTTYEQLLRRNVVQTCTLLLPRQIIVDYLASPFGALDFSVVDWPLCLFATHAGQDLAFLAVSTATYRQVAGSATNSGYLAERRRISRQRELIRSAQNHLRRNRRVGRAGLAATEEALMALAARNGDVAVTRTAAARLLPIGSWRQVRMGLGFLFATRNEEALRVAAEAVSRTPKATHAPE